MNFSASTLLVGFISGVIGIYLFKRAKNLANIPLFVIAIAMMLYPYFVENDYLLWGIGGGLLATAYFIGRE